MSGTTPKDPYNFVLGLMYYLAIGTLLPWNFFINVNGYWMYKFRTIANNTTPSPFSNQSSLLGGVKNTLQLEFTSDLAIAAMVPNVTFLVLNGLFGHRFRTTPRLIWSLALVILLFTATLVLVKVDTDHWQDGFLMLSLAIVVLINIFTALFQGGLIGLAGAFPTRYMNAVMSGQVSKVSPQPWFLSFVMAGNRRGLRSLDQHRLARPRWRRRVLRLLLLPPRNTLPCRHNLIIIIIIIIAGISPSST